MVEPGKIPAINLNQYCVEEVFNFKNQNVNSSIGC